MKPGEPEDTGLPGLRTWGRVYGFVTLTFALWVVLMVALAWSYP
ncbi:MAG TPA: hypothetical protein VHV47_13950 [Opitutaceae bacterium]|jgi:hypothetical protein|nr:hypothetical protein [Opitutaceae bacterium]